MRRARRTFGDVAARKFGLGNDFGVHAYSLPLACGFFFNQRLVMAPERRFFGCAGFMAGTRQIARALL